jgi:hypothetical protein
MKIIHLVKNNPLMGRLVKLFESVNPNENIYFVHGSSGALGVSNEKKFVGENFSYFQDVDSNLIHQFEKKAKDADLIFVQAGTTVNQEFINLSKVHIPYHLFFWGFETYLHHYFHYRQIFSKTRRYLFGSKGALAGNFEYLKKYFYEARRDKKRFDYLKKISSFSCGFVEEADWMKDNVGLNKPYFPFSFYSHEVTFSEPSYDPASKWLLLGNSATVTMNHVDAIPFLKDAGLEKIVIPLSYGDKKYARFVKDAFFKKFSADQLIFLDNYMPLEDYEALMGKCGMVFINAYCQQAVGNSINALSKGSALFFPKNGFLYRGFSNLGYKVYPPDKIRQFDLVEFTQNEMKTNFNLFKEERSPKNQKAHVINIMEYYKNQ